MSSPRDEPQELRDFAEFCSELTLDTGRPFVVEPFQRTILADYFGGATQTLVILPKKNGKSTLVAALALYHLLTTSNAEGYIAASSREQAGIILQQARKFIRSAPDLDRLFDTKAREIVNLEDEGFVKVLAADVDTADGVIPTLAVVDELHRAKSTDLMGVFRDGLGPRDGRMITISTAGEDVESALGRMRAKAYLMPGVVREGPYRYARSRDGQWVMHEWALDDHADVHDMAVVKAANPASWHSEESLRRRHDDPSTTGAQWLRFACGIWALSEDPFITAEEWDACCDPDCRVESDRDCVVAVDVGRKKDSSAVVAAQAQGELVVLEAHVLSPAPGRPVAVADTRAEVRRLDRRLRVERVRYDPHQFQESAELLEEDGLLMEEVPQTDVRMAPASSTLLELVRAGRLRHDGDPVLREHVLSAVASETDRGVRISKRKSRARIDACVAAAMAVHGAVGTQREASASEFFEVLA